MIRKREHIQSFRSPNQSVSMEELTPVTWLTSIPFRGRSLHLKARCRFKTRSKERETGSIQDLQRVSRTRTYLLRFCQLVSWHGAGETPSIRICTIQQRPQAQEWIRWSTKKVISIKWEVWLSFRKHGMWVEPKGHKPSPTYLNWNIKA